MPTVTDDYTHLSKRAREVALWSNEERIKHLEKARWISYDRAQRILTKMEWLYNHDKVDRMPNMLIVGSTNNGKTKLVKQFLKKHPGDDNLEGECVRLPVVYCEAPPVADEGRLYEVILKRLFASFKPTDKASAKLDQVLGLLQRIDTKVLIIDELHRLLSGSPRKQREVFQAIMNLGNTLQIPIIAAGTKAALRAVQIDPQLTNRFPPAPLPKWTLDAEFLKLLLSFEKVLPLKKPSELAKTLSGTLLTMSGGLIGELSALLNEAAIDAIENGTECIDQEVLKNIDWIPPDERRKQAELLV